MLFIRKVRLHLPTKKKGDCDLYFRIEKQDDSCMIYYEDNENKGVTSAEFVEGQSSDALVSVQMHRAVTPKSVHMQSAKNEKTL